MQCVQSLQIINVVFVVGIKLVCRCSDVEALDNPVRGFQRIIIFLLSYLLFKKPKHMIIDITVTLANKVQINEHLNNSVTRESLCVFRRNPARKQAPLDLLQTNLYGIMLLAFFLVKMQGGFIWDLHVNHVVQ